MPITRGAGKLAPDRQMLKINRQRVINRYYNRITNQEEKPSYEGPPKTPRDSRRTKTEIKACGVHNTMDAWACIGSGVRSMGIHLTYDPIDYERKARQYGDPRIVARLGNIREFYKDKDLPLPWLELHSIREMINSLDKSGMQTELFLLMKPSDAEETMKMLKKIIPKGTQQNIILQLQGEYSHELIKEIRELLNHDNKENIPIIQMVALDETYLEDKVDIINADPNVSAVLVDSKKAGGTGEPGDMDTLVSVLRRIRKKKYLAGGLSSSNISEILSILEREGIRIEGLDLESSVEYDDPIVEVKTNGSITKVRKSPEKINDFVEKVEYIEYMQIPMKSTPFWQALKTGWNFAKAETGYYNLAAVAEGFWRYAKEKGILTPKGMSDKDTFIEQFIYAGSTYPALPVLVKEQLENSKESQQFSTNEPVGWIREGAGNVLSLIQDKAGTMVIWTAGDANSDHPVTKNYTTTEEQKLRYEISGLEGLVDTIFAGDKKPKFIAHPDKLSIVEEEIAEWSNHNRIYVVDNDANNLERFLEIAKIHGITNIHTIHITRSLDEHLTDFSELEAGDIVIMDMDDVLIDEEFRRFHQPRNILRYLIENQLYHE